MLLCGVAVAGHDTTLSALLAILQGEAWGGAWPPYAALLSIELYSGNGAKADVPWYVRLVYNGQPIIMQGCSAALCDASYLMEILSYGEEDTPVQCGHSAGDGGSGASPGEESDVFLSRGDNYVWSTDDWLLVVIFCSLVSTFAGAVISTLIARQDSMTRSVSRRLAYADLPPYSL